MAETRLDITGSTDQAQREIDKLVKKTAQLTEQMRQMKDKASQGAKESTVSFEKMGTSLGGVITRYASFAAAAAAVTNELREQQRIQDKIAQTTTKAAGTQAQFLRNLGIVGQGDRSGAIQQIQGIAQASGVKQSDLFAAASTAMSARGDRTIPQALGAVGMAARVAPEDRGELSAVAGGLLDIGSLTGSNDWRQNLGKMVATGQQARVTSLQAVSRHLIPAAIGVKGFGATDSQALATVSTLTQAMKDPEGSTSGTAAIALGEQLEKFLPKMGTFEERLSAIQADPKLREKFFKGSKAPGGWAGASFEKKAIVPVRELLTGGSGTANLFRQNLNLMPSADKAGGLADEFISGLGAPEIQKVADTERRLGQIVESTELLQGGMADQASIRKSTLDQLAAAGVGAPRRWQANAELLMPNNMQGTARTAQAILEGARPGVTDQDVSKKLDEMINELKRISTNQVTGRGVNVDAHTE